MTQLNKLHCAARIIFQGKKKYFKEKDIRAIDLVLVVCRDSKTKKNEIINE